MMGPYMQCPCGSGKKFKWCCEKVYPGIQKALDLEGKDQHQAAFNALQEVVKKHPDNPEAWGHLARMYFGLGKTEEAEEALEKAFAVNPDYPYGFLLRGMFRYQEGERQGALLLLRKALQLYHPDARDFIAEASAILYECESERRHPIAARAALKRAMHCRPDEPSLREEFENAFGERSPYPATVCKDYALLPPRESVGENRRQVWNEAIATAKGGKLNDLVAVFERLTAEAPADAEAWFNLGLARSWLGENVAAVEAFDRYLDLDTDEEHATDAAALQEILRFGQEMIEQCDYTVHRFTFEVRDQEKTSLLIKNWLESNRLLLRQSEQQGLLHGIFLRTNDSGIVATGRPASDTATLAGYFTVVETLVSISGSDKSAVSDLREEVRQALQLTIDEAPIEEGPGSFGEAVIGAVVFPTDPKVELSKEVMVEHQRTYFEEKWIHQPRKSLAGNTPIDAVGHTKLRKKVLGIIRIAEECARGSAVEVYEFDRLRHKLGLIDAAPTGDSGTTTAATVQRNIHSMNTAELAGLVEENLPLDQLEQAWQCAQKLDAHELGVSFAKRLAESAGEDERTDRFSWFSYLIDRAVLAGDLDEALNHVNEGERLDCEKNEGKRRNDFELKRGQIHTKRGEADQAFEVFERLLARQPEDVRYHANAAEAMLAVRKGPKAAVFAEKGLEQARKQNDRDSEGHLLELLDAAKRQGE